MIKRLFIMLALVLGLQMLPVFSYTALAQGSNPTSNPAPADNVDSSQFMFDLSSVTHKSIQGSTRQSWIRQGINYFFERIIGFLATIIGSLAVLVLSVGGFMMLSSGGDQNRYDKGKHYVIYALIGLGVTLTAYILVTLVQLLIKSIYG